MLKKPYVFLESIGDNNYYLLATENGFYLAVESILKYVDHKNKKRELQQGLKLLQVDSTILKTFINVEQNAVYLGDVEVDWGNEKEARYKNVILSDTLATDISYPVVYTLLYEGYDFIGIRQHNNFSRTYVVGRTSELGYLLITTVKTSGKTKETYVGSENFVLAYSTISKFLDNLPALDFDDEFEE